MIRKILFLVGVLMCVTSAVATEPPAPPMSPCTFGLQDCVNGRCYIQQRQVVRQPVASVAAVVGNVFGLNRTVERSRTVVRQSGVVSTPVVMANPETSWVDEEIEVPVQKLVTVMEKRIVRRAVVNYDQCLTAVPTYSEVCGIYGGLRTATRTVVDVSAKQLVRTRRGLFGRVVQVYR